MNRFAIALTCHLVGAFVVFLNVITSAHAQQNSPTAIAVGTVAAERQAIAMATAKINLGYTDIVAPITGKAGKTNITRGNVVDPSSGVLTVIVSQDPMYVSFPISQREYLAARERKASVDHIKARIRFSDGKTYGEIGEINFVDVSVNRSTDTILGQADRRSVHLPGSQM